MVLRVMMSFSADDACSDHLFHLNYAITLYNNDEMERAKVQFDRFEEIFEALDDEAKNADQEVLEQRQSLLNVLLD